MSANKPRDGAIAYLRATLDALQADRPVVDREDPRALNAETRLGQLIDALDERAFGFLLLILALPCCLPFVYLLPQIVALPMLAAAGQLALGARHPWFPKTVRNRAFSSEEFRKVLDRSARYVGWFEAIARPRLQFITQGWGARLVGALLVVPTASILVPLPSTNTLPGIGVAVAALGLIERDGLLVIGGLAIGLAWVSLLLFFGLEAASLIKDFITAQF